MFSKTIVMGNDNHILKPKCHWRKWICLVGEVLVPDLFD